MPGKSDQPRSRPASSMTSGPVGRRAITGHALDFSEAVPEAGDELLAAVVELYAEQGRPLPQSTLVPPSGAVIWSDSLVEVG